MPRLTPPPDDDITPKLTELNEAGLGQVLRILERSDRGPSAERRGRQISDPKVAGIPVESGAARAASQGVDESWHGF